MRCTSAEDVAVVELDLRERADAARRDHAEQRDAGAAEHGARHPLDERRYLGQQAEDHEDRARGRRDEARSHARERDEPDVLCEGRVGEGVEDAADDRAEAVRAQAVGDLAARDGLVDDLAHRDHVARRLGHDDDADDEHRHDRHDLEGRQAEVERRDEPEPCRLAHARPVRHTGHERRDGRADHEAEQHRDAGEAARREALDEDDEQQGPAREGEREAGSRAVVAARHDPAGRDAHERQADDEDHAARHDGREEPQQLREERRDEDHEQPAHDRRAEHGRDGIALPDRDHGPDGREGHALHDRQPHAEAPEADRLEDRREPRDEEVGADEIRQIRALEAERAAHDERHGDGACVHREDVLQAEREEAGEGRDRVDGVAVAIRLRRAGGGHAATLTRPRFPGVSAVRRNDGARKTPPGSGDPGGVVAPIQRVAPARRLL